MIEAKPISFPMSSSSFLSAFSGDRMDDPFMYWSTIGSLQYLSLTHPDLAFIVNQVCQFMHGPTKLHWQVVKKILRYFKRTVNHGLLLQCTTSTQIEAFSNADWASYPDDRKSMGAYCIYLGLISFHGVQGNSQWSRDPISRQNTKPWQTPQPRFYGLKL